jgi:hypothetical protein
MLISFDVGIKNLAYCILSHDGNIHSWGVINLCGDEEKCCANTKKGICNKKASYTHGGNYYCGTHAKSAKLPLAPDVYYKIIKAKKPTKKALAELSIHLKTYGDADELCEACSFSHITKITGTKAAGDMDLVNIGIALKNRLPLDLPLEEITLVAIENQIGPIANRMKCVQGMLTQFFIDRGIEDVVYVSSSNKLKAFDVPKKTYKERKTSSVQVVRDLITNSDNADTLLKEFDTHKKKDDLADAYLQGIWALANRK